MNTPFRLILGILSTGLLAVGLARAAQQLDPLSLAQPDVAASTSGSTPACGNECFFTTDPH